jgi:DNA-binding transcriptional LysR family regulator
MNGLHFLRTFVAVARHGSFSEAAEQVGVTQAAVSFQMRALETELGRKLFDRSGRLAILNAEARELVPEVENLLNAWERIRKPRNRSGGLVGSVTIGSLVSCMSTLLHVVSRLKLDHPGLDVRVLHGQTNGLAARVLAGELDAAFVVECTHLSPAISWLPMYREPLVILAHRDAHGEDAASLLTQNPYLRFDASQRTGALAERTLREMGVSIEAFMELNSITELVALVEQGFGVTLLPRLRDAPWADNPKLRVVALPTHVRTPHRSIGMIERSDHARQDITSYIRDQCARAWSGGETGVVIDDVR